MSQKLNPKLTTVYMLVDAAFSVLERTRRGDEVLEYEFKDAVEALKCYVDVSKPALQHAKPSLVDRAITAFMLSQLPTSGSPGGDGNTLPQPPQGT